jgi:probable F420-dependent oxidoreductase
VPEKRLAVSLPLQGFEVAEYAAIAQQAENLGYTDVWSAEVDSFDCFTGLAAIGATTGLRLGTAIANVYTRGPATLAQTAASMVSLAPGRFVLGIGSGSSTIVEGWNGREFVKPATRVREMVEFLRPALRGEKVDFEGETFRVTGFRLAPPVPSTHVPIYVAALRPGMLRVAGQVADGVILNWLSVADVKKAVAVVRGAAQAAGRDPESIEVVARIFAVVDTPGEAPGVYARRLIASYLNVPVYKKYHEWLGRTGLQGMWDAWEAGDRRGAISALGDEVVDDLIIRGDAPQMRAHVKAYMDAGIDTIFPWIFSSNPDPAKAREAVRQGIRDLAPSA